MNPAKWQKIKDLMFETLDLPESERDQFLSGVTDEEIRSEVEKLISAHEKAEGFIDKPLLIEQGVAEDEIADNFIGKQIENYLILERIGEGGMGAVYLAERLNSDFKQKVALKIIKRGMDSEAILRRFARERKILSTLKHPNIAQLLDGGISKEGLPFFVMEYVEGLPLNQFCEEKNLGLTERLEIFRQICAAIEYAHKNLIIHRDLKPSNILVTNDGIPKLLDFGIAKLLSDEDGEATATQGKMFTPEYASPEQILGKNVTTATDVYSLGVILFQLLSGHRPFDTKGKSFDEIVKNVCETEPPKPSETKENQNLTRENEPEIIQIPKSKLRGDLDNIVLKSMRKEPAERYGSVQQFSEDISRFLRGLPILARPQTLKYRFEKYVKRHRVGVIAAALVLLSLIGGISVATWQAVVARRERAKAEQRFNDVRKLANSIVFELHDSIQNLPGSTPSRELLVSRALEYLDKLGAEDQQDTSLQMELADAYDKIGDIQGGFATNQLGQREKAEESYRKALAIREKLLNSEPENPEFQRRIAASYFKLGNMLYVRTELAESLKMYQSAIEILDKILIKLPNDSGMKYSLAKSLAQAGLLLGAVGDTEKGLENLQRSVKIWNELIAENPDDDNLSSMAYTFDNYGNFLSTFRQDYSGALNFYRQSQEISLKLLEKKPENPEYKRNVAAGFYSIAETLQKIGDFKTALENAQKAETILSKIVAEDPQNEEFRQLAATSEILAAGLLIKNGNADEAIAKLKKSLEILEKMKAASPNDNIAYFRIAFVYEELGYGYKALALDKKRNNSSENWKQAREYFQKSFDIYKGFQETGVLVGDEAKVMEELPKEIEECNKILENK